MSAGWKKYIVHFVHQHIDFRVSEFLSISKLFGFDLAIPASYNIQNPFLLIDLPSEEFIKNVTSRTILVKGIYELWAQADTLDELHSKLRDLPKEQLEPYIRSDISFRVNVETFNKTVPWKEKLERIDSIVSESIPFSGKVNLKSPDETFCLFEDYGKQSVHEPPAEPVTTLFGRYISSGDRKETIAKFSLKTRKFIGNTSMDPTLALVMSNQGLVKSGCLVLDPFVGTGSLLVAAAHHKGLVTGTDIDWNLLRGRGRASRKGQKWRSQDENIRNNLHDYGLSSQYMDVFIADASRTSMWRTGEIMDAIITDPPYGIREPTQKVGSHKEKIEITDEQRVDHIASKVQWPVAELLKELLNMAARLLRIGGRLVYWIPVYQPEYKEENIPQHPCLRLVANSEQGLTSRCSRRLITMEKIRAVETEEDLHAAFITNNSYSGKKFRDRYFSPVAGKRPVDEDAANNTDKQAQKDDQTDSPEKKQALEEEHSKAQGIVESDKEQTAKGKTE